MVFLIGKSMRKAIDMPVIQAKNLGLHYGEQKLFEHANFEINAGDFYAILGENGTGKTSLIRAILGQNHQYSGGLQVASEKVGYVPQFRSISRDYPLSVREFAALGFNHGWRWWLKGSEKAAIQQALEELDLADLANHRLGLSSGGQKQRAFVAQALAQQPDLLILDESTASLDFQHSDEMLRRVKELSLARKMTVLWITHDTSHLKDYANHYLWLHNQKVEAGLIDALPAQAASHAIEGEVHHV